MITCNICKKNIEEAETTHDYCELCDLKRLLYDGLCKDCFICSDCQDTNDGNTRVPVRRLQ